MDVGDGIVVITNDPSFSTVGALYVIDVRDPAKPTLRSVTPTQTAAPALCNDAAGVKGTNNGHIANCINDCRYLWTTGTEEGITVYDLRDQRTPKPMGTFKSPDAARPGRASPAESGGFTHDVFVDRSGARLDHRRGRDLRLHHR